MAIIREFDINGNKLKRQATIIKEIAYVSTKAVLEDSRAYTVAGSIGLMQGLKYNGSFKRGTKAGLATMGVVIGAQIAQNLVKNIEVIKNA